MEVSLYEDEEPQKVEGYVFPNIQLPEDSPQEDSLDSYVREIN